jgi:RNA recognition motif-containing protein
MNEEDIFPTFDSFGPLKDVAIIRDKHTQLHRGCAFVTYWSSDDAEKAQEALHGKHTFPGARRPAQVKPAEPSGTMIQLKFTISNRLMPIAPHILIACNHSP